MLDVYTWSVLIAAIFFTVFGFFTYAKNRKELVNKLFGLLSLVFAIWSYAWFALLLTRESSELAFFWARLLNAGATLIPIFYLHWVLSVLGLHKKKRYLIATGYVITLLFFIFSFSENYIKGVHSVFFFPFWPTAGPLYKWFLIFGYLGIVGYAFYLLIREFKKSRGEKRYQISYVIIGSLLGFGGGAINFPLMYNLEILQPFGVFAIIACPLVLSYAVVKHHLMNVKVITTELFSALILVIILVDALLSETRMEFYLKFGLFILVAGFSLLLIRGVLNEVRSREKIAKMARSLKKVNVELQKLDKTKSEFISIASHQLRTPLSVIKGYLSMILEGFYGSIPEQVRDKAEKSLVSNERLIKLVDNLLDLSHMEEGKIRFEFKKVSFQKIVESAFEELEEQAKTKGIKFIYHPSKKDTLFVKADSEKLRQVVVNLIDNAIKYTDKGKVEVSIKRLNSEVVFSVKDTGIGISVKEQKHLFKKFIRGKKVSRIWTEGVGLGLYVARLLIEAHHGKIGGESKGEGRGSEFWVKLPLMK